MVKLLKKYFQRIQTLLKLKDLLKNKDVKQNELDIKGQIHSFHSFLA